MLGAKSIVYRLRLQDANNMFKRGIHRRNSFYDALGITPKATQGDIKKAFYKLSMQYHPDKSTGNDSKFKEISSAYEVLGNLKLRRLYDRGMLPAGSPSFHDVDVEVQVDPEWQSSKRYPNNMEDQPKRKPMSGKSTMYDIDEWTRAHYAETFIRNDKSRTRWTGRRTEKIRETNQARAEIMMLVLGLMLVSLMLYNTSVKQQWDTPRKKQQIDEN